MQRRDEDEELHLPAGYRRTAVRTAVFAVLSVASVGLLPLACFWWPALAVRLTSRRCSLGRATVLLVRRTPAQRVPDVVRVMQFAPPPPAAETPTPARAAKASVHVAEYRCRRYVYSRDARGFVRVVYDTQLPFSVLHSTGAGGVSGDERLRRMNLYGPNVMHVPDPSLVVLFFNELLHPFFVFQVFSFALWCAELYWTYAVFVFASTLILIVWNVLLVRRDARRVRELVVETQDCSIVEYNEDRQTTDVVATNSADLLPGDVVVLEDPCVVPADMILLSGHVVTNESNLTGESSAQLKFPLPLTDDDEFDPQRHSKHMLFAGTRLTCVKEGEGAAMGLVVHTGFETAKGSLIRSILNPDAGRRLGFYTDVWKFIGGLFAVSVVGSCYSIYHSVLHQQDLIDFITYALDLVTICVPPELPMVLSSAQLRALEDLRAKGIHCTSPKRMNEAGKIEVMCFDKTGTLTEAGLEVVGVSLPYVGDLASDSESEQESGTRTKRTTLRSWLTLTPPQSHLGTALPILVCCHTLSIVGGEIIGDPVDVEMFAFTGWRLEEYYQDGEMFTVARPPPEDERSDDEEDRSSSSDDFRGFEVGQGEDEGEEAGASTSASQRRPKWSNFLRETLEGGDGDASSQLQQQHGVVVVKRFEFLPEIQRQVVVAKSLDTGELAVMAKGAPEVIRSLCHPASLPSNFDSMLGSFASQGLRVLGLAGRPLPDEQFSHSISREELEHGLEFRGLLVLNNPLKEDSAEVIAELAKANIRSVIVTGDNLQTAVSVARSCGIVESATSVYYGEIRHGALTWTPTLRSLPPLDPILLRPMGKDSDGTDVDYVLAVHGNAFQQIVASGNGVSFRAMLKKTQVFARMLPNQKRALVDAYENVLDVYAGMCGDGSNDAAALKAARVGLSLGESEASIAAPFTSTIASIKSVPVLLKEGRCAISTSFNLFKFMALYSLINFFGVLFLYHTWSDFTDWEFFYLDLVLIIPSAFAISRMKASPKLSPVQPVDSLISFEVIGSIAVQTAVQFVFLSAVYFWGTSEPWYVAPETWSEVVYNVHPSAIVFLFQNFQYLIVSVIYARGRSHHQKIIRSPLVVLISLWVFASNVFLLFQNFDAVSEFFELPHGHPHGNCSSSSSLPSDADPYFVNPPAIPTPFRWNIAGMSIANLIVSILCEEAMYKWVPALAATIRRRRMENKKKKKKAEDDDDDEEEEDRVLSGAASSGFLAGGPSLQQQPPTKAAKKDTKGKSPEVPQLLPSERTALLWHPHRSTRDIRVTVTDDSDSDSDD